MIDLVRRLRAGRRSCAARRDRTRYLACCRRSPSRQPPRGPGPCRSRRRRGRRPRTTARARGRDPACRRRRRRLPLLAPFALDRTSPVRRDRAESRSPRRLPTPRPPTRAAARLLRGCGSSTRRASRKICSRSASTSCPLRFTARPATKTESTFDVSAKTTIVADRVDHRRRVDRVDVQQDDVGLLARRERADPVLEYARARSVDRRELEHVPVRELSARTRSSGVSVNSPIRS